MPYTSPLFDPVLGRSLTSIVFTPYSIVAGVATAGSAMTLLVNLESLKANIKTKSELISPINSFGENEVEVSRSSYLTLEIFRVNGGGEADPLLATITTANSDGSPTYTLFHIVYTEAGSGTKTREFWGSLGGFETGYQGRGKQIATLSLNPVVLTASGVEVPNFRVTGS